MSSSGPVGMRLNLVAVERHLKPKRRERGTHRNFSRRHALAHTWPLERREPGSQTPPARRTMWASSFGQRTATMRSSSPNSTGPTRAGRGGGREHRNRCLPRLVRECRNQAGGVGSVSSDPPRSTLAGHEAQRPGRRRADRDCRRRAPVSPPALETVRLYASDWAAFVTWCRLAGSAARSPHRHTSA
jgi:hypothetical protein